MTNDKKIGDAEEALAQLEKVKALIGKENTAFQQDIDDVMRPVKKKYDAAVREHETEMSKLSAREKLLTERVKLAVVAAGGTVTGTTLQAVLTGPKPRWDSKMLEGMAAEHEFMNKAKSMSDPSVAIRSIREK